jgi:type VII secretion protein EccE
MSEAPPQSRRPSRRPPRSATASAMPPRRQPGHVGSVNVLQLLLLELVLIGVLIALRRHAPIVVAGVLLGVLLLAVTFGRYRGRWWSEYPMLFWQYRRRCASSPTPTGDRRLNLLRDVAPDLNVQSLEAADGTQIGIGTDGAGSFAVLAVGQTEGVRDAARSVPLQVLARVLKDAQQPGAVVQLVTHTIPALHSTDPDPPLCDASYAELLAPLGGAAPADQITWVAVRLDARTVAESAIAATSIAADEPRTDLPELVAVLVRRASKALRRAGCPAKILDSDGVLDALVRSLGLDSEMHDPDPVNTPGYCERWQAWQSASLAQACFWLRTWPSMDDAGALLGRLSVTPAAFTSVVVVLQSVARGVVAGTELRCLIRVAAPPETLGARCTELSRAAGGSGGRLFRLDGEQVPAAYASAPTGSGLP